MMRLLHPSAYLAHAAQRITEIDCVRGLQVVYGEDAFFAAGSVSRR